MSEQMSPGEAAQALDEIQRRQQQVIDLAAIPVWYWWAIGGLMVVLGVGVDIRTPAAIGITVPVFVVGYVLAYVFALELEWLPVQGYTPLSQGVGPWLHNLLLPALALGCVYIALIARITRAAMLEVLQQDYIRTARAKGLGQGVVLFVHALKNASVPIVTPNCTIQFLSTASVVWIPVLV